MLQNWPYDKGAGGWVGPHDDPIRYWVVATVHAYYEAPRVPFGTVDDHGRPIKPRPELHAYHVDLIGDLGMPDHKSVLLHQVAPSQNWMIKPVTDEILAKIAMYRVTD
ncbi:hypothetical protein ACFQYP_50655 [Nonomuraea antimicrobica]|uniref:hypothetical protein n=1 Tax=Nonomuraea antimicrobica TaxID=561173 RepID=UPI0031EBAF81